MIDKKEKYFDFAYFCSDFLMSLITLYMIESSLDDSLILQEEDLKVFRQWGSCTPGHPENFETPGIEVTTGL